MIRNFHAAGIMAAFIVALCVSGPAVAQTANISINDN